MIQAIMMEVPGIWASIINPQYQKMLREFQNAIKYYKESLEKLEAPVLQRPCFPNQEYTSMHFFHHIDKAIVNPDILVSLNATYTTGAIDGFEWETPYAVAAILKLAVELLHLSDLVVEFFTGARGG